MSYQYAQLNPETSAAAQTHNDAILDGTTPMVAPGIYAEMPRPVFGIDISVPELASRCMLNLDPHGCCRAAIDEAVICTLPPAGAVLAVLRADVDSIGAMAVIGLRSEHLRYCRQNPGSDPAKWSTPRSPTASRWQHSRAVLDRIDAISASDRFYRRSWPGPQPLPNTDQPWSEGIASSQDNCRLAAIGAAVADTTQPIATRVGWMQTWLLTGDEPTGYREQVERERADLVRAFEAREIVVAERDGIATVTSKDEATLRFGYCLAEVVVHCNPACRVNEGEPYLQYRIGAFDPSRADLKNAVAQLSSLEPGWTATATLGSSPAGVSSTLTLDQVVDVVREHLLRPTPLPEEQPATDPGTTPSVLPSSE